MSAHKRETAPQLQQKVLQLVDECLFQRALQLFWRLRDVEEFKNIGVTHNAIGRSDWLRGLNLCSDFFFVPFAPRGNQTVIVEGLDLPVELAGAPSCVRGFVHIPQAPPLVVYAHKHAVVRPAQFGTQCVPNWKREVKLAHGSQVTLRKALAKVIRQTLGEV